MRVTENVDDALAHARFKRAVNRLAQYAFPATVHDAPEAFAAREGGVHERFNIACNLVDPEAVQI